MKRNILVGFTLILFLFLFPHSVHADDVCISPSPTIEVTPTQTPHPSSTPGMGGNAPTFAGSTTEAPAVPTCTISFAPPILQGYSLVNGVETYQWWPSTAKDIIKQSLVYGYEVDNPIYGVADLAPDVTSIDIKGLDLTRISYLQVWSWNSNGCVAKSNWLN